MPIAGVSEISEIHRNQAVPNKKYKKSFCFFDTTTDPFECHFYFRRSKMRPVANSVNRAGSRRHGRPASLPHRPPAIGENAAPIGEWFSLSPIFRMPAPRPSRRNVKSALPADSRTVIVQLEPFR
jgi:hypothetical protein